MPSFKKAEKNYDIMTLSLWKQQIGLAGPYMIFQRRPVDQRRYDTCSGHAESGRIRCDPDSFYQRIAFCEIRGQSRNKSICSSCGIHRGEIRRRKVGTFLFCF